MLLTALLWSHSFFESLAALSYLQLRALCQYLGIISPVSLGEDEAQSSRNLSDTSTAILCLAMAQRGALVRFRWNGVWTGYPLERMVANTAAWAQPVLISFNFDYNRLHQELSDALDKHWDIRAGIEIMRLETKPVSAMTRSVSVTWHGQADLPTLLLKVVRNGAPVSTDTLDMRTILMVIESRNWIDCFDMEYAL